MLSTIGYIFQTDLFWAFVGSLWRSPPQVVYTAALAAFAALWIGILCFGQLNMVAAETTSFEVRRNCLAYAIAFEEHV
jgi:hypothetical protein